MLIRQGEIRGGRRTLQDRADEAGNGLLSDAPGENREYYDAGQDGRDLYLQ